MAVLYVYMIFAEKQSRCAAVLFHLRVAITWQIPKLLNETSRDHMTSPIQILKSKGSMFYVFIIRQKGYETRHHFLDFSKKLCS